MAAPLNLKGRKYGRWTVLNRGGVVKRRVFWLCRCSCGEEKEVPAAALTKGKSRSCGCLQKELSAERVRTHGMSNSRAYSIWQAMHARCKYESSPNYDRYGGRGIKVCSRWDAFENFLADMGEPPESHSIDRIDFDGDYSPENCRWATSREQSNNKSTNKPITCDGITLNQNEWAASLGMPDFVLYSRLATYKWSTEEALKTPYEENKRHSRADMLNVDVSTLLRMQPSDSSSSDVRNAPDADKTGTGSDS